MGTQREWTQRHGRKDGVLHTRRHSLAFIGYLLRRSWTWAPREGRSNGIWVYVFLDVDTTRLRRHGVVCTVFGFGIWRWILVHCTGRNGSFLSTVNVQACMWGWDGWRTYTMLRTGGAAADRTLMATIFDGHFSHLESPMDLRCPSVIITICIGIQLHR
ncbi:hypothetical protein EJ06DRAFT_262596 [Trichodelitschia bisporula]|uniref:Uncharacterized protein n=1 Tax=Trichodelitschia bisporula TaxID=703511 RepID=A0A6G1HIC6_9PEZI|nr:hypothetical protein EJ06DRAFT_262596 [Trichodelitschia bisporula]